MSGSIKTYAKKSLTKTEGGTVRAIKVTKDNLITTRDFARQKVQAFIPTNGAPRVRVHAVNGIRVAKVGDYVLRHREVVKGKLKFVYQVMSAETFESKFELV